MAHKLKTIANDSEVFIRLEESHHILPLMRRRCCRKEPRTGAAPPSSVLLACHVLNIAADSHGQRNLGRDGRDVDHVAALALARVFRPCVLGLFAAC